jgi:hypothetical protein
VTKDVLSPETLAFRRGPLSGFVDTTERRCSREGMEAVARTLLGRLQDDAGPPSRSASPPPR